MFNTCRRGSMLISASVSRTLMKLCCHRGMLLLFLAARLKPSTSCQLTLQAVHASSSSLLARLPAVMRSMMRYCCCSSASSCHRVKALRVSRWRQWSSTCSHGSTAERRLPLVYTLRATCLLCARQYRGGMLETGCSLFVLTDICTFY